MSLNKVHIISSKCMYLFNTIYQNANIFFVKRASTKTKNVGDRERSNLLPLKTLH